MSKIKIVNSDKEILYNNGENLLEILLREGIFIDNPCNGKGVCGKCRIKVTDGNAGELSATESKLLEARELEKGIRLPCLINPDKDLSIELFQEEGVHKVLTAGYIPEFDFNTDVRKTVVNITKPGL